MQDIQVIKEKKMRQYQKGFTLIEIALVLVIVGLMLAGSLSLMSGQRDSVKLKESQTKLENLKNVLLNFAAINGYLPCADGDGDGKEDRASSGACSTVVGTLPYSDIGVSLANIKDGYGNKIRYAINTDTIDAQKICYDGNPVGEARNSANYFCNATAPNFTFRTPPTNSVAGNGDYTICDNKATCAAATDIALSNASVVLIAFNKDGPQQLNSCSSVSDAKEKQNCDANQIYVQGTYNNVTGNFFDDNVVGITGYEIKQKTY